MVLLMAEILVRSGGQARLYAHRGFKELSGART